MPLIPTLLLAAAPVPAAPPREVNSPSPAARAVWIADAATVEPRSEVLVLGTPHLSALPADFDPAKLEPLLARLAAWRPAMIMIEGLGGAQCDYLRSFSAFYPETAENYCPDTAESRKALGVDQAGAEAAIEKLLREPRADRPPAERRHLAALFLAAGDPASALVQWLRLSEGERTAGDGLTDKAVEQLRARGRRPNENRLIAAALAARLGHERVWPVDDHTGDRATGPESAGFEKALKAIWNNRWSAARRPALEGELAMLARGNVLAVYRSQNSASAARYAVASDFAAAAGDRGAERFGRRYLAYWETRNLRMVANIREAMGPTPGTRVLAIVGASHKPYYERFLGVLSEVRIADADAVLR